MYVDLILNYDSKADLIAAIGAEEIVSALDVKTGEALPDGKGLVMRILGYPNYHSWTSILTIKDGRIIDAK